MSQIQHSWRYRRSLIFTILVFSMGVIVATLFARANATCAPTVIKMAFGTITLILSSYVFAATWDDKRKGPS